MAEVVEEAQFSEEETQPSNNGPEGSWSPKTGFGQFLDRYFHISERGSSIIRELLGGLVTFLAMFYILPLNSNMLAGDWANVLSDVSSSTNLRDVVLNGETVRQILIYGDVWATVEEVRAAVFAATAISAAVTTILMGLYGKLPVGLASGLGINSLIAYTVMLGMGMNFAQSMAIVMVDGILFLIISATPLRAWIIRSIPKSLKFAISAGIGFFIAFIGCQNMGIIVGNSATLVAFGDFTNPAVLVGAFGVILVIILSALPQKNKALFWINKFAVIIAIVIVAILAASLGSMGVAMDSSAGKTLCTFYDSSYSIAAIGNFSKIFGCCFFGFDAFANPMAYVFAFTLLFVDFFDTAGTLVGVEAGAGMINERGELLVNDQPAMITDAIGTCWGAICGTTTVTSFVESTTGVAAGARTGLAAVTTGALFGLSILIYPALAMFSSSAVTGLALVYVGICMFKNLEHLEWKDWTAVASGFITALFMCIAYSISDGIAMGFISYTVMTLVSGKFKKSDIPTAVCSVAFLGVYIMKYATYLGN